MWPIWSRVHRMDRRVVLLHGFPYDVRSYDVVAARLAGAGRRVIVPWLRGFGPTRFLSADTPRVGQQAALGGDLLAPRHLDPGKSSFWSQAKVGSWRRDAAVSLRRAASQRTRTDT